MKHPASIIEQVVPISIDIETASTEKDAVILSIGAYNIRTKEKFYVKILSTCPTNLLRDTSKSTMYWWDSKASAEAKEEAFSGITTLAQALLDLKGWLELQGAYNNIHVFANPSDFDCVIIENAVAHAKSLGMNSVKLGWRPTNVHCFKTITLEHWGITNATHVEDTARALGVSENKDAHTALADAVYQGEVIGHLIPALTKPL